ncbi:MAG: hypothetical protein ACQ9MH_05595 [Nitrospinales bacterium]
MVGSFANKVVSIAVSAVIVAGLSCVAVPLGTAVAFAEGLPIGSRPEKPADTWLGKWSAKSMYKETSRVWKWWFEVLRNENRYLIQTHTEGPNKTEVLFIGPNKLEFLFNDALGTHLTLSMTDKNTIVGKVDQPNNRGLPHGRVEGHREAQLPAEGKRTTPHDELDKNKGWLEYGTGDCSYHDVGSSEGAVPDDAKAQEGYVAICWDGDNYKHSNSPRKAWCTYKKIAPAACTDGENTGVMYSASKEKVSSTACEQLQVSFLQIKGNGLTPVGPEGVRYGTVFVIEARCDSPQDDKTRKLTLDWGSEPLVLVMERQSDSQVYRSEKLFLMPPEEKGQ